MTLPDRQSLAFIHCIEDPGADSELSKVSSQVMWDIGPGEEGYLIQHTRDVGAFWANKDIMEFGAVYDGSGGLLKEPISPEVSPRAWIFHKRDMLSALKEAA